MNFGITVNPVDMNGRHDEEIIMISEKAYDKLLHDIKRIAITFESLSELEDLKVKAKLKLLADSELKRLIEDLEEVKNKKTPEEVLGDYGNYLFNTYLIGSMEATADKDSGKGWRQELSPYLKARKIYVFDPTREEIAKVGMPTEEFHEKLTGLQLSGNYDIFVEQMDLIWRGKSTLNRNSDGTSRLIHILGDIDYVERSKFLIMRLKEGDRPGGTIAELVIAWYRGIPVYLITDMPKFKINKSLLYFILDSGHRLGRIFKNQSQLIDYIDIKYDLKEENIDGKN